MGGDAAGLPAMRAVWHGARTVSPLLIGVVPFGIVAVLAAGLPSGTGLLVGAGSGIAAGVFAATR